MANFSIVASWLAIIGIIIGLFSPKKSLVWYLGRRSRSKVFIIYSSLLLLSFIIFALTDGS